MRHQLLVRRSDAVPPGRGQLRPGWRECKLHSALLPAVRAAAARARRPAPAPLCLHARHLPGWESILVIEVKL